MGTYRKALLRAAAMIALLGGAAMAMAQVDSTPTAALTDDGRQDYAQHCAACHGAKLEGQPEWRKPLPNGRMPAPPHDDRGHTWHHPDEVLFGITKHGLVPPYAPAGYQSDMPGFAGKLTDGEIRAVLAYISAHWSNEVQKARSEMLRERPRR
jgi:mono/diheme cytochrome c family protein